MTNMVFCRSCGNQMHETAPACPGCGFSQKPATQVASKGADMGFWAMALQPFKKYADFKGRASRKEYWGFILVCFIVSFVLGFVGALIHANWLANLFSLAILVPSIAVAVRRMHDTD